nr:ribonuclease H-like domain-containing protein [Tanacetum cinerariifolium]
MSALISSPVETLVFLYMHDPRESPFAALKRILRYVRCTLDYGLQLHVSSNAQLTAYTYVEWVGCRVTRRSTSGYCVFLDDNLLSWSAKRQFELTAYTDVEWAGCPVTQRSTFGYCVFLYDNLLSWPAKRQVTLSRSSAEAEYRGVANVVVESAWIYNLLRELHTPFFTATLVYYDNVSVVYMSVNPVQHQRTKHIKIDIHFVRDYVAFGQVRVLHVLSRFQYADIFTNGLSSALFLEFRSSLNVLLF